MESGKSQQSAKRLVVIACRVMEPELEAVRADSPEVEIIYLEQGLHRTPKRLPELIQEKIDQVESRATEIVLGYGLCSNGLVGITARCQKLIVPRCHDCISLFLGSAARYDEIFRSRPGTYYLTSGWIVAKDDPLGIIEEYIPRYGSEAAEWIVKEELKNYTHVALINTGMKGIDPFRIRAIENATFFKKKYDEITGSLEYFKEFICGPYSDERFLQFGPETQITQEMFF